MDLKQRKSWNENHKMLKNLLNKPGEHLQSIKLFLSQHSLLHCSSLIETDQITLEDVLLKNLAENTF